MQGTTEAEKVQAPLQADACFEEEEEALPSFSGAMAEWCWHDQEC